MKGTTHWTAYVKRCHIFKHFDSFGNLKYLRSYLLTLYQVLKVFSTMSPIKTIVKLIAGIRVLISLKFSARETAEETMTITKSMFLQ